MTLGININTSGKIAYEPLEITLNKSDDFLKIRETLTRIGETDPETNVLYQSCHILHRRGRYYIMGFNELYALDGEEVLLSDVEIEIRNTITKLLQEWGMLTVKNEVLLEPLAPMHLIKVIQFKDKHNWTLEPIYKNFNKQA